MPDLDLDEIFSSDPRELTTEQRIAAIGALRDARATYVKKAAEKKAKKDKKSSEAHISLTLDDLDIKL